MINNHKQTLSSLHGQIVTYPFSNVELSLSPLDCCVDFSSSRGFYEEIAFPLPCSAEILVYACKRPTEKKTISLVFVFLIPVFFITLHIFFTVVSFFLFIHFGPTTEV